jgi:hypothetical protein
MQVDRSLASKGLAFFLENNCPGERVELRQSPRHTASCFDQCDAKVYALPLDPHPVEPRHVS